MWRIGKDEIERGVIGSLIMWGNEIAPSSIWLDEKDFFNPEMREIFSAISRIEKRGEIADIVSVTSELKSNGSTIPQRVLVEVSNEVYGISSIPTYVKRMREETQRAEVYRLSEELRLRAESGNISSDVIFDYSNRLLNFSTGGTEKYEVGVEAYENLTQYLDERKGKDLFGYSFGKGFEFVDKYTRGIQKGKTYRIGAPSNEGKAMPLYEKILTPNGWTTFWEVKVWDEVVNSYGWVSKVTWYFPQWVKSIYRVKFNDWTYADSCNSHLWEVSNSDWAQKTKVLSLDEIMKYSLRKWDWWRFHVRTVKPVSFWNDFVEKKLDPYVLGLLLADGHIWEKSTLQLSNVEKDVLAKFSALLPEWDELTDYANNSVTHWIKGGKTVAELRRLGLSGKRSYEKFIPEEYKFSSKTDRIELVRGMIDWDGYVPESGKTYEYSTTSERLKDDFVFIIQSLGWICVVRERFTKYDYQWEKKTGRKSYSIIVSISWEVLASSEKHRKKIKEKVKKVSRKIVGIEYLWEMECACIMVDAKDHMYVTSSFILTHNTQLTYSMINSVLAQGAKVVFFTLENDNNFTLTNLCANFQKVNPYNIERGTEALDTDYVSSLKEKFFLIDDTYELSEIFARIQEIKPDVVFLDFIGQVDIKGTDENSKYGEYARRVQKFVKRSRVSWIDLSNLPKSAEDEDSIKATGGFFGDSALKNLADVGIHLYRFQPFNDFKNSLYGTPAYDMVKNLKVVGLYISKNRLGVARVGTNLKINFDKGGEVSEATREEVTNWEMSFPATSTPLKSKY